MNLPNILTVFRVLLAPFMVWIIINPQFFTKNGFHESWVAYFAGLIFVIASVTDFFDGYIARNWNQMTKLGAILDPLADKMLVLAAFLGLMYIDRANPWAIFLILTREFFITGLRVLMASEGKNIKASFVGKTKTVAQMFAIGFLMMNWSFGSLLLWFAVVITLYSGFEYIYTYIKES